MSYRQDIRERPSKNALSDIWIDLSTAQPIYPTSLPDGVTPPDPQNLLSHTQDQQQEIEIR